MWRPTAEATRTPWDGDVVDAGAPRRCQYRQMYMYICASSRAIQSASLILIIWWRLFLRDLMLSGSSQVPLNGNAQW